MAQRIQVETQLGNEKRKAVASPVDQFVQVNPNGGAAQLARALGDFAPAVRQLGLTVVDMKHADDREKGKALAGRLALQKKTFEQAVKDGTIPRGANPFFFAGVKEQFGKVAAGKFSSDLRAATELDENMRTTTSIADYDAFVKDKSETWLKDNVPANQRDEFFDAGFNDMALNAVAGQREQFAAGLAARVEKLGNEAHFASVSRQVQSITPENRADVIAAIQDEAETLIAQGHSPMQVVRTMARAVKETAVQMKSYAALDVLKELHSKDGKLADTEYGKALLLQGKDEVRKAVLEERDDARTEREIERSDRTRKTLGDAMKLLVLNPQANVTALISANDDLPDLAASINTMKNSMTNLQFDDDQKVYGDLAARIWVSDADNRTTAKQIAARINNGLTTASAIQLMSILDQRERAERSGEDDPVHRALRDPGYLDEKQAILSRLDGLLPKEMADRGQRLANSTAKLSIWWLNFLDNGGSKMDWVERRKRLNAQAAVIIAQEEPEKVRIDEKSAAFTSDGKPTDGPKGPRYPKDTAIRMGRELQSGNLSETTQDYMTRNGLDKDQLRVEVKSALIFYSTPGGK